MNDIEMWDHYCPVEKTVLSVEKGYDCNWCDTKESYMKDEMKDEMSDDENEMIQITEMIENEDGSANLTIECDDIVIRSLIREGFRELVSETEKKVIILPPSEPFTMKAKTYEMSDDEAQLMLQMGFIAVIQAGMNKEEEVYGSIA